MQNGSKFKYDIKNNYDEPSNGNLDDDEENFSMAMMEHNYNMSEISKPLMNRVTIEPTPQKEGCQADDIVIEPKIEKNIREVEWYEFIPKREPKLSQPVLSMTEMINTRSCNFDPIVYMSKYTIKCKKLHYSVPQFYDDIPAIISYDNEANTLKIFNIEGNQGNNKSKK